jgi:hypothetical protein
MNNKQEPINLSEFILHTKFLLGGHFSTTEVACTHTAVITARQPFILTEHEACKILPFILHNVYAIYHFLFDICEEMKKKYVREY